MRKYSVYNLKVVKVETSTNTKYFICRYNNLTKEYIEVLTGEKIDVKNSENVERLANYYSVLGLHCYGMPGSKLELTKKDILNKYLEINSVLEKEETNNNSTSKRPLHTFSMREQELLEKALLGEPKEEEFCINYFPTNKTTKSLFLDDEQDFSKPQKGIYELSPEQINETKKKIDEILDIIPDELKEALNEVMIRVGVIKTSGNTELTELEEGLKRTREELVSLCESDPEQAKELAIEALIRTGVIESSNEVEKGKAYIKERKDK